MVKVTGLDRIEKMVATQNAIKKLNRQHYNRVVKQYIAEGVDKEIAKVMAKNFIEANLV